VAKVFIVDNFDRAFVLTLGEHKVKPERSFLPDLPGGIIDSGEPELDAVIRETKEEAGITLTPNQVRLAFAATEYFESENKVVTKLLYLARIDHEPTVTLSWEHSAYEWIPLGDVLQQKQFRPFFQEAIDFSIKYCL
jgi:8-oxo-dGTP pyrophosphatase MutT (NUDIX family)